MRISFRDFCTKLCERAFRFQAAGEDLTHTAEEIGLVLAERGRFPVEDHIITGRVDEFQDREYRQLDFFRGKDTVFLQHTGDEGAEVDGLIGGIFLIFLCIGKESPGKVLGDEPQEGQILRQTIQYLEIIMG